MASLVRWVGRAIGLDVHRDFCVVAICEDGEVRLWRAGSRARRRVFALLARELVGDVIGLRWR